MKARTVTVRNENGLHARVALQVVRTVNEHNAKVTIASSAVTRVDAASVLQLLTLCATEGTELLLEANGPDEESVTTALADLFEHGGGI